MEIAIFTKRTYFVLGMMTFGIIVLVFDSIGGYGWVSAAWWGYGLAAVNFIYAFAVDDKILKRFMLFAFIAGLTELLPDAWLVNHTKTLFYPPGEPMLYKSPAYMPFSWVVVLIQIGYLGWLVSYRWGILKACLSLGLLGGALIPLYEHWAINAGWWHYESVPMLSNVPYYIILAEAILMITVPFILRKVEKEKYYIIPLWGILEGLIMWLACIIAYKLCG